MTLEIFTFLMQIYLGINIFYIAWSAVKLIDDKAETPIEFENARKLLSFFIEPFLSLLRKITFFKAKHKLLPNIVFILILSLCVFVLITFVNPPLKA